MSVVYRLARLEPFYWKYSFNGCALNHTGMVIQAKEIYQTTMYFGYEPLEWVVVGATSLDMLATALERKNTGKCSSCCTVRGFLMGALSEQEVVEVEREIYGEEGSAFKYNPAPSNKDITTRVRKGTQGEMSRMFGVGREDRAIPAEPLRLAEKESRCVAYSWTEEDKRRLNFYKWMVEQGKISEELEKYNQEEPGVNSAPPTLEGKAK